MYEHATAPRCLFTPCLHTSWGPEAFLSDWQADCRNAKDKAYILDELEKGVGFDECNAQVLRLLREALVAQGRAALGRLPAAERGGSGLLISMGWLLEKMGKGEEARLLYEEVLQAQRETLGDRHPSTLSSINNMGALLKAMGQLEEARPLLEEALQGRKETLGDDHQHTRNTIGLLDSLLKQSEFPVA